VSDLEGLGQLAADDAHLARTFCDQPGRTTRAEYVEDARQAKRLRKGEHLGDVTVGPLAQAEEHYVGDDLPEDNGPALSTDILRNMGWWDSVGYDSLQDWTPTVGKVPKDLHHGLALLRGAVCKEILTASDGNEQLAEERACKLLTFLDRLVLCTPGSKRGGKNREALNKVVASRLRSAWRGDWGTLWREAAVAGERRAVRVAAI
jgi:hypothetical protein